jgi:hypothetical protein
MKLVMDFISGFITDWHCYKAVGTELMEAENTSETSANFYQATRRNNQEDSHLIPRLGSKFIFAQVIKKFPAFMEFEGS